MKHYKHTFQPNADRQGTIHVCFALSTNERHSMEQPEYANINKPKKQMVSPKVPSCQNLNASPNQESQELYPSEEGSHIYDQPVLPKKELPPQMVSGTVNMGSNPNGEFQELYPSEEGHIYDQLFLPRKDLSPQTINGTGTMNSSPNGEPQELPPSEEVGHFYTEPDLPKKEKKKHHSSHLKKFNQYAPPVPPRVMDKK